MHSFPFLFSFLWLFCSSRFKWIEEDASFVARICYKYSWVCIFVLCKNSWMGEALRPLIILRWSYDCCHGYFIQSIESWYIGTGIGFQLGWNDALTDGLTGITSVADLIRGQKRRSYGVTFSQILLYWSMDRTARFTVAQWTWLDEQKRIEFIQSRILKGQFIAERVSVSN